MRMVRSYPIPAEQVVQTGRIRIPMPRGARVVSVGAVAGTVYLYAEVDGDEQESDERVFAVVGSDEELPRIMVIEHIPAPTLADELQWIEGEEREAPLEFIGTAFIPVNQAMAALAAEYSSAIVMHVYEVIGQ